MLQDCTSICQLAEHIEVCHDLRKARAALDRSADDAAIGLGLDVPPDDAKPLFVKRQ